ncbi:hypothetical protein EJB05_22878 [Eragrostis curvula]|uniref:Chloride conductance regulatory protein ICln n=1 Tax=Eragrostis curvula TaxID=38414 RepID=A0A5J9V8K6_9POAL|nr:hypothetical protein EJB05_22878 [Eragrostis curvula]
MVLGLYPFTDIAADGTPRLDAADGEEVVRVERTAALALGPRAPEPHGTLFLTTRRVIWVSEAEQGKGYAVDFVAISLHAVSRDPEAYPSPCIYTQGLIETVDGSDEESDESDSETNGEIELSKVTEMRIIPSDPSQCILLVNSLIKIIASVKQMLSPMLLHWLRELQNSAEHMHFLFSLYLGSLTNLSVDGLFEAFSHCAELNPDPNAESDEENGWVHGDEGDEDMTDGSDAECEFSDVNPIGQTDDRDITHAVVELQINDQRFEDAEEADEESQGNGH